MTPFQLEPSAKAPCTSTIVGLASVRWAGSAVAVTRYPPSGVGLWVDAVPVPGPGSAQGPEGGPELLREQLWLFPGGEVSALVDLVEVDEVVVGALHPVARRLEQHAGERA